MKIKFLETPKGRPEYKKGETYEFNGAIEEIYARKYLARGWAEPADKPAEKVAAEDRVRKTAEAQAAIDQAEKDRAEAEARIKARAEAQQQANKATTSQP